MENPRRRNKWKNRGKGERTKIYRTEKKEKENLRNRWRRRWKKRKRTEKREYRRKSRKRKERERAE